jgi:dihydrofolate reductase
MISIIVSYNAKRVIGDETGNIPWKLPEDMHHFKVTTAGCPVIMGRKTWLSLPEKFRPLPGRFNVIVTTNPAKCRAEDLVIGRMGNHYVNNMSDAIDDCCELSSYLPKENIYIIGGASIYQQALRLNCVDRILASEVRDYKDVDGPAKFPEVDWPRTTVRRLDDFDIIELLKPEV